jgi:hypothetical protein
MRGKQVPPLGERYALFDQLRCVLVPQVVRVDVPDDVLHQLIETVLPWQILQQSARS